MKRGNKNEQEEIQSAKSIGDFVEYYNENIPKSFPKATKEALIKFRATHPSLFKDSSKWVADKHRKRLIDWLAVYDGN